MSQFHPDNLLRIAYRTIKDLRFQHEGEKVSDDFMILRGSCEPAALSYTITIVRNELIVRTEFDSLEESFLFRVDTEEGLSPVEHVSKVTSIFGKFDDGGTGFWNAREDYLRFFWYILEASSCETDKEHDCGTQYTPEFAVACFLMTMAIENFKANADV